MNRQEGDEQRFDAEVMRRLRFLNGLEPFGIEGEGQKEHNPTYEISVSPLDPSQVDTFARFIAKAIDPYGARIQTGRGIWNGDVEYSVTVHIQASQAVFDRLMLALAAYDDRWEMAHVHKVFQGTTTWFDLWADNYWGPAETHPFWGPANTRWNGDVRRTR